MNAASTTMLAQAVSRRIDGAEAFLEHWDASLPTATNLDSCRWPGCDRIRQPKPDGRSGRPAYCGQASYEGFHPHTGAAASKAKALSSQMAASRTPVLAAAVTARDLADTIATLGQQQIDAMGDFIVQVTTLTDGKMYDVDAVVAQAKAQAAIAAAELQAHEHQAAAVQAELAQRDAQQAAAAALAGQREADAAKEDALQLMEIAQAAAAEARVDAETKVRAAESSRRRAEDEVRVITHDRDTLREDLNRVRREAAAQIADAAQQIERLTNQLAATTTTLGHADRAVQREAAKTQALEREVGRLRQELAAANEERQTASAAQALAERELDVVRRESAAALAAARATSTTLRAERNLARARVRDLKALRTRDISAASPS